MAFHPHDSKHNKLSPKLKQTVSCDGHDHADSHHHGHHHHDLPTSGKAFALAIFLNSVFVSVEFGYGVIANSTALIADAGHNLSDVLGLILSWGAARLSRNAPSSHYTYGLRSTSILAALLNAMLLLVACGAIAWEAVQRFSAPPTVTALLVMQVAGLGILINGFSAWLFVKGSKQDLNVRGAYLHMAADTLVSLGVVLAGLAMMYSGWYWLDPAMSMLIVAVIVYGTWDLLRQSIKLVLNAVPTHIDLAQIEAYLKQFPGVTDLHDLHVWGMSTTETALTVHLVMPTGYPGDAVLDELTQTLKERFAIQHSTLQVERGSSKHVCALHPVVADGHQH